ncbi:glycosyl hydrolases family 18 protein-like protein [Pseudomassariella vexata]|uniref:chitinase n=1 Tax=Pseudomassariella vexata TaxID=1141098 RepID=A0A1Y2E0H3_9PEZI|nr:glycosyl hydrolases family 18 protein-like protein [Pseudomassariella vexata]ORY64854.1 glycosyl hydrolases family 18 protein-like protein [Pseudomassariella vexata]
MVASSTIHLAGLLYASAHIVTARPPQQSHSHFHSSHPGLELRNSCRNLVSPFDYSAKVRARDEDDLPLCFLAEAPTSDLLLGVRQAAAEDDYSCSENKPCSNGACCPKATGYCNYGEEACGTTGTSPNDVCWSNCDAYAECGRDALVPGTECPLNVCCSKFGFCGMTSEFCEVTDDEETSCQSNCKQPGSGASDSNVRQRIIGYYEAWAHDRECQNMNFKDIPVGALTHAYFSFAFITPGTYMIAPMDDLSPDLFEDFTAIKQGNTGLKAIIAVGGWSFNDPGATQTVFSDMVASPESRKTFIGNLMGFMRKYGFDGVDFDWEYPGADDRGGKSSDGENFVTFLKELDEVNNDQPEKYVVSFTVPTSYWYLRHFDLTAVDHVDFVNVMSYDLHGIWDSTNPIGSHVYAHTNLTEIKDAFDLFWRNGVKAEKLNLGLGFYGRSFQLSDPTCYTPGCMFRGGASPGPCSQNSGTLTYREIMDIVKDKDLEPYYDEENAVKYVTWNEDQWVSYDDAETFQQKIDFANDLGLGGLLIWALDQDTDNLEALTGVVGEGNLRLFSKQAANADTMEGVSVPDCYVTDCGGTCDAGFLKIENQPCGSATWLTRHSTESDSLLCCPLGGAPSASDCEWRGTAPSCNGHCHEDEVALELNRWGDGKYCEDGNKAYCCKTSLENECYWTGEGQRCNGDDVALTFAGTFLQRLADIAGFSGLIGLLLEDALNEANIELLKLYCCPKDQIDSWQNCAWHGEEGSCFDNHCPTGHSVQLTDNAYGEGIDCGIRLERTRVFCCDPADNQSPFLPVELGKLFPSPPQGDNVDTDYELSTDETWGTSRDKNGGDDDEPDNAAFQFVVLASPEELQVSLDKRDGSHWDLNCYDADPVSEEPQTIQMVCTDMSENSNCHKIGLGKGVPGTILQMPEGCGPGKYAVAVDMKMAEKQILPRKFGGLAHKPIIYDLTFDYDFSRVPREEGQDTQMRVDFSNEPGYWDTIVAAAASKKRKSKRTLEDVGGDHVRWLEEEFRDDFHLNSGLFTREIHERWFGSGIIAWLTEMLSPTISKEFKHVLDNTYTLNIIDAEWDCPLHSGRLLAQAETNVHVETSFGFTLVCRLLPEIDLSDSFLTFTNNGEITATFRLEAYLDLHYDSLEKSLIRIPFPGAAFKIPGIALIGPALHLKGRIEAGLVLSAVMETQVDIASWEFQTTLPPNDEYKPEEPTKAGWGDTGDFNGVQYPQFYAGVTADGNLKAHAIAAVEFGISFDTRWNVGGDAIASVVADGWVEAKAHSEFNTVASCPFVWGVNVGVDLYAQAQAPDLFNWKMDKFPLPGSGMKSIIPMDECPGTSGGLPEEKRKRGLSSVSLRNEIAQPSQDTRENFNNGTLLNKRAKVVVPAVIVIPAQKMLCPEASQGGKTSTACELIKGWEDDQYTSALRKREYTDGGEEHLHKWDRRVTDSSRTTKACLSTYKSSGGIPFLAPPYDTSGTLNTKVTNVKVYGYVQPGVCNNFDFDGNRDYPAAADLEDGWATEHILELQLVSQFFDNLQSRLGSSLPNYNPGGNGKQNMCQVLRTLWQGVTENQRPVFDGKTRDPVNHVLAVLPGNDNNYKNEFVLLDSSVNTAKERMFSGDATIQNDDTMRGYDGDGDRAVKNLKDVMTAMKYLQDSTIASHLLAQKVRIGDRLRDLDTVALPAMRKTKLTGAAYGVWQPMGLEALWNTFMRDKGATARSKAILHIDTHLAILKEGFVNDFKKEQAATQAAQGDTVLQDLIEKIDKLDVEWARYKPNSWTNPF